VAHNLAHLEARPLTPVPPRWVEDLLGRSPIEHHVPDGDLRVRTAETFAHATTCIRDAVHLNASALKERVVTAYLALIGALDRLDRHPIRFWNFIPRIGERISHDLDRYMVFNAGRYDAFTEWYGTRSIVNGDCQSIGTASAVGITGSDLSIHCLAMERPGAPVENPRQTSAWQYSARYGPVPPCFSRATIVQFQGRRQLLIGGTASVVGEDSRHPGDLNAQVDETLLNLEALVRTASADVVAYDTPLQRLIDLRVHITAAAHSEPVSRILSNRCPQARTVDVVIAQVCRPELLVEIEGVAEL
jgi:enamine deaminase RidA (YjgF/YER057c/UK114 family)